MELTGKFEKTHGVIKAKEEKDWSKKDKSGERKVKDKKTRINNSRAELTVGSTNSHCNSAFIYFL